MLHTHTYDSATVRFTATPQDHPIKVTMDEDSTLVIRTSCEHAQLVHGVSSHRDLEAAIQTVAGADMTVERVHPHPQLSRMISLRTSVKTGRLHRRHYKDYVRSTATKRGDAQGKARAAKWGASSTKAAEGLAHLEWTQVRRNLGIGQWGEQLLYRLKAWAYPMYDVRNSRHGSSHVHCANDVDVDMHHVFLRLNNYVGPWLRLGMRLEDIEKACFGLALPAVPAQMWEIAAQQPKPLGLQDSALETTITGPAEGCWRVGTALYFHAVWRWRVQHFDENNDVTGARHRLMLSYRLRQSYANMYMYMQPTVNRKAMKVAVGVLAEAFSQPWQRTHQEVHVPKNHCEYLLFFDGGSRGNPGPGGAGAVIVRFTPEGGDYQIVWGGSMSYAAPSTTNNLAENMGLLVGLTACERYAFSPLHVVGDSAMIIRQHAQRRPPRAPHLAPIYWRSRRRLARLKVVSWQHHRRDFNKMADQLANKAMDTKRSTQLRLDDTTMAMESWSGLVDLARGDVGHWTLNNIETMSPDIEVVVL